MSLFSKVVRRKELKENLMFNLSILADRQLEELAGALIMKKTQVIINIMSEIYTNKKTQNEFKNFLTFHKIEYKDDGSSKTAVHKNFIVPASIYEEFLKTFPIFGFSDRSSYMRTLIHFFHSKLKTPEDAKKLDEIVALLIKKGYNVSKYGIFDEKSVYIKIDL